MGLIYLTGMTGAGKTTVGEKLAAKLGVPFVDIDREIERAAGKSITDIFAEAGESEFRDCEAVALTVAADLRDAVIALGAGALSADDNFELIQESGNTIYLRAGVDVLAKRLEHVTDRPMLSGARTSTQMKRKLQDLLDSRQTRYAVCDIIVDVDEKTADEIVAILLRRLAAI